MEERLSGVLDGVSRQHEQRLRALVGQQSDPGVVLSEPLLTELCAISAHLVREVSLFLSPGGRVLHVALGRRGEAPVPSRVLASRRQRLRCVHTHPGGNPELSPLDRSVLHERPIDVMAAVGIAPDGSCTGVSAAIWANGRIARMLRWPDGPAMLAFDLAGAIRAAAGERHQDAPGEAPGHAPERALLIGFHSGMQDGLDELAELCKTAHLAVAARLSARTESNHPGGYLGKGKRREAARLVQLHRIDVVVADDELTPGQVRTLEEELGVKVIDRALLILDVFAARARSREGKLQVELAQLKTLLPRLSGRGTSLSRLGGGIGTRGPGETKLETDRRTIRRRIHLLERELAHVMQGRTHRQSAQRSGFHVALVGYTNAGKSTLLNALTRDDQLACDMLFATLDPVTRRVDVPGGSGFLLSDTVGFIRKLPHSLVAAFRATLDEVRQADLLLHVVDAQAPGRDERIRAVHSVLAELGRSPDDQIMVFNKSDLLSEAQREDVRLAWPGGILLSASSLQGISALQEALGRRMDAQRTHVRCAIEYDRGDVLSLLHEQGSDVRVEHAPEGYLVSALVSPKLAGWLVRQGFVEDGSDRT